MEEDTPDAAAHLTLDEILQGLSKGTVLYKIKSLDTFNRRKYRIDLGTMRMKYSPSKKKIFCNALPHVDLNEIEEIRRGWKSDFFCKVESKYRRKLHWKMSPLLNENCCLSVVLGPTHQTIDLLAPTTETRDAWFRGLTHLVASCKCINRDQQRERWLKQQFQKADQSNNGVLSFSECVILLHNMNVEMDRKQLEKLYKEANFRKSKVGEEDGLDMEEFLIFYNMLNARPELEALFKKYCVNDTKVMGPEQLLKFLKEEQKVNTTIDNCKQIIERFENDNELLSGLLSYKGFRAMMLSKDQDIFNKDHRAIYQDMNQPLTDYYISTSHNTYLTEGQLVGASSVEGYIRVLKQGVRCVELDLWDGPDNEPVVYHGYTLTSKILVRDALEAIREYLFVASQYPVILSLENHCSVEQQHVVADHITTFMSDFLYKEPITKEENKFPSPADLARKVLVKAKKIEENHDETSSDEEPEPDGKEKQEKKPHHKISQKLSDLVNYFKAMSFKTFREVFESRSFYEMSSFEEVKADHLIETASNDFIRYNQSHFSRIYPKGTRVESSNMDPTTYWNVGCHMVALNCQNNDQGMFLHRGQFMANGGCGYVLKPEFLRKGNCSLDEIPKKTKKKTLTMKIISGQYLPRPPGQSEKGEVVDPYVTVTIYGHPVDKLRRRTTYISNNGFNPQWNETLIFPIQVPELATVLIHVKDNNNFGENLTLAQYSLPFTSITQGYRHIHLWDNYFEELPLSGLFVHITITDD